MARAFIQDYTEWYISFTDRKYHHLGKITSPTYVSFISSRVSNNRSRSSISHQARSSRFTVKDLRQNACTRSHKPEERLTGPQDSGQIFRVELNAHEIRMIFKFEDFHAFATVVASDEVQASALQCLDVMRVDFPAMTMTFIDDERTSM